MVVRNSVKKTRRLPNVTQERLLGSLVTWPFTTSAGRIVAAQLWSPNDKDTGWHEDRFPPAPKSDPALSLTVRPHLGHDSSSHDGHKASTSALNTPSTNRVDRGKGRISRIG